MDTQLRNAIEWGSNYTGSNQTYVKELITKAQLQEPSQMKIFAQLILVNLHQLYCEGYSDGITSRA